MHFELNSSALKAALARVVPAVPSSGANPALLGAKIVAADGAVRVATTDGNISIIETVPATVHDDGTALVPAKVLHDLVKEITTETIEVKLDQKLEISAGSDRFGVAVMDVDTFPRLAIPSGDSVTFDAPQLFAAIKQAGASASTDESRPILTGVLFAAEESGLRLVATDSYRLAVRDLPGVGALDEGRSVLVNAKATGIVTKVLADATQIAVRMSDNLVAFASESTVVVSRLILGEYPNYQALLPSETARVLIVPKRDLVAALRKAKAIVRADSIPVTLNLGEEVTITASSAASGDATIAVDNAEFTGEPTSVAFNGDYMRAGIEQIVDDNVRIGLNDPLRPMLITGDQDTEYRYLCMPMRTN